MKQDKYRISEVFYSPQGEGRYTGQLTAWVRSFLCNLQCDGFGQKDPTDPSTYELPYKDFDVINITRVDELPVFSKGCDSSYSWAAKYKHLCPEMTGEEIADKLIMQLPNKSFYQKHAGNLIHLAFTGGEPLLPKGQKMIIDTVEALHSRGEFPEMVTIETNGTQEISNDLYKLINSYYYDYTNNEFFLSISPKLFNVSGETRDKAIVPKAIKSFRRMSGQLKFVMNTNPAAWNEMEEVIKIFQDHGVNLPVWVMPVGGTIEGQNETSQEVAEIAMSRGYNIASRVHINLWGNKIGT